MKKRFEDPEDKLNISSIYMSLTKSLLSQARPEGGFVLAINAPWGHGKSFFIAKWKQYLDGKSYKTILFNAWENDFAVNPLFAFAGAFNQTLGNKLVKSKFKALLKNSLYNSAKVASADILDLEKAEKLSEAWFSEYKNHKKNVENFETELSRYASKVAEGKPLVVFIDELDRCRPTYAIQLLESIKHFFDVANVVFVLAINKSELEKSISVVYGTIDADVYLRKFFDFVYHLPASSPEIYFKHLLNVHGLSKLLNVQLNVGNNVNLSEVEVFETTFLDCVRLFNMSLRDQDQCFMIINFAFLNLRALGNKYLYPETVTILVICQFYNKYNFRIYHRDKNYSDFLQTVSQNLKIPNADFYREVAVLLNSSSNHTQAIHQIHARAQNLDINNPHYRRLVENLNFILGLLTGTKLNTNISNDLYSVLELASNVE